MSLSPLLPSDHPVVGNPRISWNDRLKAAGNLVIFLALIWVMQHFVVRPIEHLFIVHFLPPGMMHLGPGRTIRAINPILMDVTWFFALLFATWLMSLFERKPLGEYGLPVKRRAWQDFGAGAAAGFLALTLLLLCIKALGGYDFGGLETHGLAALKSGVLWAIAYLAVGFAEEYRSRGYQLVALSRVMTFWPAAILTSAYFAYMHINNAGETRVGLVSVVVFGVVFCFAFRRSGALWLPIGFHFAWDWAQSFVYGVPDSGIVSAGRLFAPSFHGPDWLTGGTVGPEGSYFCPVVLALLALWVAWRYRGAEPEPIHEPELITNPSTT